LKIVKDYESDGDLKFAKANELRSQVSKQEFQSWKNLGCKPRNVQNTEQGYNFGTQKFVNKRMARDQMSSIRVEWE
jgi:hypothetical protein